MTRLVNGLTRLLLNGDTLVTEVLLGWLLFNWGLWTMLGGVEIWQIWVLGFAAVTIGAIMVVAVAKDHFIVRRACTLLAAGIWLLVATNICGELAVPVSTLYLGLSVASLWLHVRVRYRWGAA
jgi:hypothetical protein